MDFPTLIKISNMKTKKYLIIKILQENDLVGIAKLDFHPYERYNCSIYL